MKLLQKISIPILSGAFIVVFVVAYFSYIFIQSLLIDAFSDNQRHVTRQTMDEIDRVLYERKNDIEVMAEDVVFEELLSNKNLSESNLKSIAKLKELSFLTGPWDILTLVNTDGTIVASMNKNEVGEKITRYAVSTQAFIEGVAGRQYHSDLVISARSGKPAIIFASPVRDEQSIGQPIVGVIIGHFSWAVVQDLLALVPNTYLFNKDGLLIGSQAGDLSVLQHSYRTKKQVAQSLQGKTGTLVGDSLTGQNEALVSYVPQEGYLSFQGNDWGLVLETPTELALFLAEKNTLRLVIIVSLVTLISYFLMLFWMNLRVIGPIISLTDVVRKIKSGNFNAKARLILNDEIGELASSFNSMTDGLVSAKKLAEDKKQELQVAVDELVQTKSAMLNLIDDLNVDRDALAQANTKDEAILSSIGDAVFAVNTSGKIILFNRMASKLTEISETLALGAPYRDVLRFAKEDKLDEPVDSFIQEALKGKISWMADNDMVLIRKDGTYLPVADSASPIKDAEGVVKGAVIVFRDVTAERKLDQQKMQFLSITSHQLRTPLGSMRWNLEYILAEDLTRLPTDIQQRILGVYESNIHMITLVRDLLSVDRIEADGVSIEEKLTNLNPLLELAVKEAGTEALRKGIVLSKELEDLPQVMLDPKRFRESVQNLLSNAIKYNIKDGKVFIRAKQKGDKIVIEVQDTGVGIPKEDQDKMFSKFFRSENAVRLDPEGNGLGLYIVKSYVEEWGGVISFVSGEGGTTFTFTIPVK